MQRWLVPAPPGRPDGPDRTPAAARRGRPSRLSEPELDLLESTTAMFRQWDAQCGGGLRRKAVVGQLHEVTDLLQEPQPEPITQRLFKVAAELAELAGWMSYDVGLQPTAQKYFVLALHAAKEAGDKPLGSYVLSSMSRQMIHLGRPDDALELIHLAQYGSRDCASPAHPGHAVCDGGPRVRQHGPAQQVQAGRADGRGHLRRRPTADEPDPDWIRFFSEAELHGENAHSYRDLAYVAGRSPTYASLAEPRDAAAPSTLSAKDDRAPAVLRAEPDRHGHRPPAAAGARAGRGVSRAGHARRQEGALRARQHPYPQDRRHRRPRLRRRSRGGHSSPTGSPSNCRRPPRPRRHAGRGHRLRPDRSPSPPVYSLTEPQDGSSPRNTRDFFVTAAKHRAASTETPLRQSHGENRPTPALPARAVPTTRRRRWHQPSDAGRRCAQARLRNTAFMLISSALVMLMTPGLAFFYGGMVRVKSTLNMLMMSFISMGIVTLLWAAVRFQLRLR